jgi:hypothetical protein
MHLPALSFSGGSGLTFPSSTLSGSTTSSILNAVISGAGTSDGSQNPISLTLLTATGAVGVKGGPNLAYVATSPTIGSGVGDNTSTLSLKIPSSSMGGISAAAGTGGILLTLNFGIPACLTGSTSALQAGTHTTKKHLELTEPVIKSIGKHDAHKTVHAQLMQHGNDTQQKDFNTHAPARSLQKDDLWAIHGSRRLTCHHYSHQLSLVIQVRGGSKHQAQPMNQSFVAAINAATSYKPI